MKKYKLKSSSLLPKLASGSVVPGTQLSTNSTPSPSAAGVVSSAAGVLSTALDFLPDKEAGQGISYPSPTKVIGKGVLSGAATGASLGSVVPGIGTAIGAGVGALAGGIMSAIGSNRQKKEALARQKAITEENGKKQDRLSASFYSSVPGYTPIAYGKQGMAMPGEKADETAEKAQVLEGQRHSEKGVLGKGNPGLDEQGQKVVEVERGELLLTLAQSQALDNLRDAYRKTPSEKTLFELGKQFQAFVKSVKK